MANLQVYRKRLKSIQTTGNMALAMKTVASVKYSRLSKLLSNINTYSDACDDALSLFGNSGLTRMTAEVKERNCIVLFSSDRGFCGGFNSELFKYFESKLAEETEPPMLIVWGQKGINYCQSHGLAFESFETEEIPAFDDARRLTEKLYDLFHRGEVKHVFIVYQRFKNMMTQIPDTDVLLPAVEENHTEDSSVLFLPDRETALFQPAMCCLTGSVFRMMLSHSAGAQAATAVAMRSACDNAEKSAAKLEVMINHIRQAEVTNSVIETSASLADSDMESM